MKKSTTLLVFLFLTIATFGQEYFPKNNGIKEKNTNYTVFTNAIIHIDATSPIENGSFVIQNGKIIDAGTSVTIPKNAVIIDLNGKHIYPSFIDPYTNFGVSKPERASGQGRSPQYEASREGFYWNDHIMPENNAIAKFKYDPKLAAKMRKLGFGVVNTHIMDGIARGTGVLVALNDDDGDANRILEDASGQFFSFSKSVTSRQSYPTSLMGATALLRQFYADAAWYAKGNVDTKDRSIEAFNNSKNLVSFFEAGSKSNNIRADKIGEKYGVDYVIVGGGDEYEAIERIKQTNASYIIPINFPNAFDVSDPYLASYLSIEDMREWNQAPINPKMLADNNINFALTTYNLKKPEEFSKKLNKAFTYGFDKVKALEALTTIPAKLLGKSNEIGSLQKGNYANFLITSGEIFDEDTILYQNWVQGNKNVINPMDIKDIRGTYALQAAGKNFSMQLSGKLSKPKIEIKLDTLTYPSKIEYTGDWVTILFSNNDKTENYRATGRIIADNNVIRGKLLAPNGTESIFSAKLTEQFASEEKSKDAKETEQPKIMAITYPNNGYGFKTKPKQETILFKNATVWTGEKEGILNNTDVLIKNGKIAQIGKNLSVGNATVIDATGKHLTAGVIDEHSHIAALSINEAGHNSSAEVTIEDVVDPEDINIYRNLAGGVTSIQILHGSANPIGGRSAIIKLKWSEDADGLIYKNSPKFIKFALGENVKQSNWESYNRFPQTRMGVEQLYVNYFNRARQYEEQKKTGNYRWDEEMEVLLEILNGERFISCHSYVQSEINMLMKVAERFNFKVNTFTHILEGYKVADKMAAHGVAGSTFSDWWAYKYEVNDAIPYNAAIMASQGVLVAINSDDREMSRRLNQEAAKTIKYGGMSEEEAWKTVTLNPAKMLHIDDRVGSIKEGKDADVVLWNNHPMSVYAKAEKTMIDGAIYFDLEKDKQLRNRIKKERNELTNMMLAEKNGGKPTRAPKRKEDIHFECETIN